MIKDRLNNNIEIGDIILMANLSLLEEHVVISIPSKYTITVSTTRSREERVWRNKVVWENWRNCPITNHNAKITKWVRPERVLKIGKFSGDMKQFKTINQLEKEYVNE